MRVTSTANVAAETPPAISPASTTATRAPASANAHAAAAPATPAPITSTSGVAATRAHRTRAGPRVASLPVAGVRDRSPRGGGQTPKRARRLAEQLVRKGDRAEPGPRPLLDARRAAVLNWAAAAAAVAILILMVWKPGA